MSTLQQVGSVVSLWRYPVKSMLGEELNSSAVFESGLLGDRAFALVDRSTGKIASAKNPVKWGKLFDCRAAFTEEPLDGHKLPPVKITLPDGKQIISDRIEMEGLLSGLFGRSVTLMSGAPGLPVLEEYWPDMEGLAHRETVTDESIAAASPRGSFYDYAVVHILTTATLDHLRSLYPDGRFEVRRFRPNVVVQIDSDRAGFVENDWVGKKLLVGTEVAFEITDPCARCVMTTLPQSDLPADPGILRTAARHNKVIGGEAAGPQGVYAAVVGVYARVLRNGQLHRGDEVRVEA